jgi:hypothetical protein
VAGVLRGPHGHRHPGAHHAGHHHAHAGLGSCPGPRAGGGPDAGAVHGDHLRHGSFRPVSPVVFINVEDGFQECVDLHEKLQTGPLERELPFAYHPHVTIAHDVAPESLDEAETVLKDYRATFPVVSMGLYEHDTDGIWQLREELDFGTEPDDERDALRATNADGATAPH